MDDLDLHMFSSRFVPYMDLCFTPHALFVAQGLQTPIVLLRDLVRHEDLTDIADQDEAQPSPALLVRGHGLPHLVWRVAPVAGG